MYKINEIFKNMRFERFRKYCISNNISFVDELESVDFVMFKNVFHATDEEKDDAKRIWKRCKQGLIDENELILITSESDKLSLEDRKSVDAISYASINKENDSNHKFAGNNLNKEHVVNLINKMEKYFSKNHSYFSTDAYNSLITVNFEEIEIMDQYTNLFYKLTSNRVALIKWVIDEITKLFDSTKADSIDFDALYSYLNKSFSTGSFNRKRLKELLESDDKLTCEKFRIIKEKYDKEYYQYLNKYNDDVLLTSADPRVKSMINQILGEQVFTLDEGIVIDFSYSEQYQVYASKLSEIIDVLGKEICISSAINSNYAVKLINMLNNYVNEYGEIDDYKNKLTQLYDQIYPTNLRARIEPLILAYKVDDTGKEQLLSIVSKAQIYYVKDLLKISWLYINTRDYLLLERFIKWLKDDKKDSIRNELELLLKEDRSAKVIKNRAAGLTLEATGNVIGVTRERVRQIEKRYAVRLLNYIARVNPHLILYAYGENKGYISYDEIQDVFSDNTDIFLYAIKQSNIEWAEEINGAIIGDSSWYSKLKKDSDDLSDMISISEVDTQISNIIDNIGFPIEHNIVKSILFYEYTFTGQVYHRKKIRGTQMYLTIIEKYYQHGIKLYDEKEHAIFRNRLKELFGDSKLPTNQRAIDTRIADMCVLCDRGTYILPKFINIEKSLLEQIIDYINKNERNSFAFIELFEIFKDKLLLESNVNNRFFLQGVLKYYYKDEFYFSRDTISKTSDGIAFRLELEEFIKKMGVVTKNEIKSAFRGITEAMLFMMVIKSRKIIVTDFAEYMHSSLLDIVEQDYEILAKIIDENVYESPISSRKLLDIAYLLHPEFINRNNISTHTKLFGILQYMFWDRYKFSRPFIANGESEDISTIKIIKDYLADYDQFTLTQLIDYCKDNHLHYFSYASLLRKLSEEYLRVDSDLCINIEMLNINENAILIIEEIISDLIKEKGYVSIKSINDFMFYPDLGVNWTGFLLRSVIENFIDKFAIVDIPTSDGYTQTGIIVDSNLEITNYETLIRYAVKNEHNCIPFKSLEEIKDWLRKENLVNQGIPKIIEEQGYITVDEYGKIIIG